MLTPTQPSGSPLSSLDAQHVEDTLSRISPKWTTWTTQTLAHHGPLRTRELAAHLPFVREPTLRRRLGRMHADGLVTRVGDTHQAPYQLSALGAALSLSFTGLSRTGPSTISRSARWLRPNASRTPCAVCTCGIEPPSFKSSVLAVPRGSSTSPRRSAWTRASPGNASTGFNSTAWSPASDLATATLRPDQRRTGTGPCLHSRRALEQPHHGKAFDSPGPRQVGGPSSLPRAAGSR